MRKKSLTKERLQEFFKLYGPIALVVYLVIFALVFAGFVIAISTGLASEDSDGSVALFVAAWVATKLTQPLRIGATLVLTPLAARLLRRDVATVTDDVTES